MQCASQGASDLLSTSHTFVPWALTAWGQPNHVCEFSSSPGKNSFCTRCLNDKRSWMLVYANPGVHGCNEREAKMLLEIESEPQLGSSWKTLSVNVSKPHSCLCPHLVNRVRFIGIHRQNTLCFPPSASDFEPVPMETDRNTKAYLSSFLHANAYSGKNKCYGKLSLTSFMLLLWFTIDANSLHIM